MKTLTIWIFCLLYILVSLVSTIHIISFFELSNPHWLAVTLGIAFELGSAASLASIVTLKKANKYIIWSLFFVLTAFQIQANSWWVFSNVHDYKSWVELFWLNEASEIAQKRVLSLVSGAILPIVALGFIKSLVDYLKPDSNSSDIESSEAENGTLDHVPTDEEIAEALARNQKGQEQEMSIPIQPKNVELVSGVEDKILRNRELAAQLVENSAKTENVSTQEVSKTQSVEQIDNQANRDQPLTISSDERVTRGMQVNVKV